MNQTDNGKEAMEFILSFMASIFVIYPAMKEIYEFGIVSIQTNIPLQALTASVIFAGVTIGVFLFIVKRIKVN